MHAPNKKILKKLSQAGYFYDQKELIISGWPWFSKPNMGRTRREASSKIRSHKYSGKSDGEGKEKEKRYDKVGHSHPTGENGTLSLRSLGGQTLIISDLGPGFVGFDFSRDTWLHADQIQHTPSDMVQQVNRFASRNLHTCWSIGRTPARRHFVDLPRLDSTCVRIVIYLRTHTCAQHVQVSRCISYLTPANLQQHKD